MDAATINSLLDQHADLRGKCARQWYAKLDGFEFEDLMQELWLAMREAALGWRPGRLPFPTWAWIVMERRVFRLRRRGLVRTPAKAIVQLRRHEFGPVFDRGAAPLSDADSLVEFVGASEAELERDPEPAMIHDPVARAACRKRVRDWRAA